jgi:hypothetical protein
LPHRINARPARESGRIYLLGTSALASPILVSA